MEFWGVEVKGGDPLLVNPGTDRVVHLSQACIGDVKKNKGSESVHLYLNIDGKKLVIGTLSSVKFPQLQFDLVMHKTFELSHDLRNGTVYFHGYRCKNPIEEGSEDYLDEYTDSESDEELPVEAINKEKSKLEKPAQANDARIEKTDPLAAKKKVKIVEPNKDIKMDDGEGDSDDEDDESDSFEDDESSDSEDSDEEEEETGKKVESGKKRPPAESTIATPTGPEKKAKLFTPQKNAAKKVSGHVGTPHPSKQAGKPPANQSKEQTPKSAGSHHCKSCKRAFKSEEGLQSHTKAKHGDASK